MKSRRVVIAPAARRDILRLGDFLADSAPNAAKQAGLKIAKAVLGLGTLAERGRLQELESWRELVVPFGRYGYVIRYAIDDDVVLVSRVFHSREDR